MQEDLPEGYRPSESEPYMSPMQLAYFRRKLLQWRDELLDESEETIRNLRNEEWREPDPNDRASRESDASLELRTRDRYRKLIGKIDAALRRIDDGSYGYCEETGEPIGLPRLEARPIATLTVEAQERHERDERR
ncbi:RNA polymerase-binding protein DksA [Thioalkalivibrio sulfidiphilus]|uniref:RNA polymerase-binding transcription factor DksA n=1 Tax=Thioalkalivibrio sulfidiphilus (strain HL-EbGR7) TaxID=396588 RepID=B8GLR5_THISH|nr:RNA polymerase-binding protein DksA [Thioalkalivibrio sulfidiphilus]ACL71668.1 transcriptional regulator, TraR/DksA family [Thioalkalivibrio sulfidiphilus HL-EbGr7]